MKTICKWSCVCVTTAFMLLAFSPSAVEAAKWRRYKPARVVHSAPVYVAPVRVYKPVRTYVAPARRVYHPPVHVVTPGVRVHVGGYGGVSVNVGGWRW